MSLQTAATISLERPWESRRMAAPSFFSSSSHSRSSPTVQFRIFAKIFSLMPSWMMRVTSSCS